MNIPGRKLTAKEGYVLRIKGTNTILGDTVYTGYVYHLEGKDLTTPLFIDETTLEQILNPEEEEV